MTKIVPTDVIRVVCIKTGNTKLIKGGVYLAECVFTNTYYNVGSREVQLKSGGTYKIDFFTYNGEPLDNVPDFNFYGNRENIVKPDKKDYTGQFVTCRAGSGKYLKTGEIYYVEEQKNVTSNFKNTTWSDVKFKIRGIKNLTIATNFNEIDIKKQRSIKLNSLNGETTKTGDQTRKFLLFSEKERTSILFQILSKVLIDLMKVELDQPADLTKMMITKGKIYNITEEDIKPFLTQKIENLLKLF